MPFCCQCGSPVGTVDRYCGSCGAAQPIVTGTSLGTQASEYFSGINSRTAALLCYIPWFGWIAAVIVLASQRFRRDHEVRFHAFQGLYLFIVWLLVHWLFAPALHFAFWSPFPHAGIGILNLLVLVGWVVMLVKVSKSEHYRLPIIGDLAERSLAEQ